MATRWDDGTGGTVLEAPRTRAKPARPPKYVVVMFNDDYTPAEFVVAVLQEVFRMDMDRAMATMLAIHKRGVGACGVYPRDVAETKVQEVGRRAALAGHPLKAGMEKE